MSIDKHTDIRNKTVVLKTLEEIREHTPAEHECGWISVMNDLAEKIVKLDDNNRIETKTTVWYIDNWMVDHIVEDTFTKQDNGKPQLTLIEPEFVNGVANVLGFGAEKYSRDNWKEATPDDVIRFKDALLRHSLAYANGEEIDPDSEQSHAYHIACNAMFIDWHLNKNDK